MFPSNDSNEVSCNSLAGLCYIEGRIDLMSKDSINYISTFCIVTDITMGTAHFVPTLGF